MGTTGGRTTLILSRIHIITRAPDIMGLESTTASIAIIIATVIELTSVSELWKNQSMSTSIRNRLAGTIEKIVSDKVVSEVVVRTAAGIVTSIITTGSVERMNLKQGDNVFAIIKATEVSIEKE